jgi:hypothetical protein
LEEGFSDSDSNNSDNDSGPAGRQGRQAEFGEGFSWLRQKGLILVSI